MERDKSESAAGAEPLWENLAFEGGGIKGMAYSGAVQVLEEEGIYPGRIRRVAGASIGSLCATLVALGYSSRELADLTKSTDLAFIMQDARFGKLGGAVNVFRHFGMNPGTRLFEFIGRLLEARAGSKDVTFAQLLERTGRELCVPVTNLTRMCTEFCHPKTTPNLSVRMAVATSMSLPVLMRPRQRAPGPGAGFGSEDLYTDGGVLCNYPLQAFDGWWLSMRPEDAFLRRLQPISQIARLADPTRAFSPRNPATLGFTTFNGDDRDVTASWTTPGVSPPPRPKTRLALARRAIEAALASRQSQATQLEEAFSRLFAAMLRVERDGDGRISRSECEQLFEVGELSQADAMQLFGTTDVHAILKQLDRDDDGFIDFAELQRFMDAHNVDLTARMVGRTPTQTRSVGDFVHNLLSTLRANVQRRDWEGDHHRTVAIDTDYIGTADFGCVAEDFDFLVESGARHTRAFLAAARARARGDAGADPDASR